MTNSWQLDLFTGAATEHSALVYARLLASPDTVVYQSPGDPKIQLALRGSVVGPFCKHSHTLPATLPFVPVASHDQLLARAFVPDPCCWSTELPALYEARLELVMEKGIVVEQWKRRFGIRRFAPRDNDFIFDQKRFVLRGAWQSSAKARGLAAWRNASAAIVVEHPTDAMCAEASGMGVVVVACIDGKGVEFTDELRRLAQWPAVVLCVIDGELPTYISPRRIAPNLTVAQRFAVDEMVTPDRWAEVAFVEMVNPRRTAACLRNCALPVMVCRRFEKPLDLPQARAGCDELQREMVSCGDFAGYFV